MCYLHFASAIKKNLTDSTMEVTVPRKWNTSEAVHHMRKKERIVTLAAVLLHYCLAIYTSAIYFCKRQTPHLVYLPYWTFACKNRAHIPGQTVYEPIFGFTVDLALTLWLQRALVVSSCDEERIVRAAECNSATEAVSCRCGFNCLEIVLRLTIFSERSIWILRIVPKLNFSQPRKRSILPTCSLFFFVTFHKSDLSPSSASLWFLIVIFRF